MIWYYLGRGRVKVFAGMSVLFFMLAALALVLVFSGSQPTVLAAPVHIGIPPKAGTVDPSPVIPEGTPSWQVADSRVKLDRPAGYGRFLQDVTGVTPKQVSIYADMERAGVVLKAILPAGTKLVNTTMTDGGQFAVLADSSLNRDRDVLTKPDGTPVILTSCGNPMRLQICSIGYPFHDPRNPYTIDPNINRVDTTEELSLAEEQDDSDQGQNKTDPTAPSGTTNPPAGGVVGQPTTPAQPSDPVIQPPIIFDPPVVGKIGEPGS